MARLMLQTKAPEQTIKRVTKQDATHIPINEPYNFNLLTDNRCEDEKFSRVDKFFINHSYMIGTEWLCERIFYPSTYGFEEVEKERDHPFKKRCNVLVKEGKGLYGDRPIPLIDKPIKRVSLKCRPQRVTLSCVDD